MKGASLHRRILLAAAVLAAAAGVLLRTDVLTRFSAPILVAVIDSGLDPSNAPELASRVDPNGWNFFDDNHDTSDLTGHGTLITKIIAERCPRCRLLPLKVTRHGGGTRPADYEHAIRHALKFRARVINISSGANQGSPGLEAALREADAAGAVVVTAAGIGVPNPFRPAALGSIYPQAYSEVIVVGSSDLAEKADDQMNFGPALDFTVFQPKTGPDSAPRTGSSYTAAEVSGLAARVLERRPGLAPASVRQFLRAATQGPARPDFDRIGFGWLDREAVLRESPAALGWRIYAGSPTRVDFNSARDITGVTGRWDCPGTKAEPLLAPAPNPLRKGRARLELGAAPAAGCRIHARLTYAGGIGDEDLELKP